MKNTHQDRRTFIEVIFILIIVVTAAGNFFFLDTISARNNMSSKNLVMSRILAQKGMEAMLKLQNQNKVSITIESHSYRWSQLFDSTIILPSCSNPIDPTAVCADFILNECEEEISTRQYPCIELSTNPHTDTSWQMLKEENRIFSRKIRITDAEANFKNITSFIWWTDATGLHNSFISRKLRNAVE